MIVLFFRTKFLHSSRSFRNSPLSCGLGLGTDPSSPPHCWELGEIVARPAYE